MRIPRMVFMMKNELQVIVKVQKGEIAFNFDELKEGVTGIASAYEGATFCDESIPNAKNEIASLRKIRMAIDTRRKEVKKECMLTYEAFEDKVKEIFEIIDKPITDIGRQIEDFELRRIMEKRLLIQGLYANIVEDNEYVTLEYIFNDKWLNKTYKLDDIAKEIEEFEGGQLTTATEYIGERQDQMQELNRQRQEAIRYIQDICKAVLWFSNTFHNTSYNLEEEILVNFDDSYITDKEAELERKRNDALSFSIPKLTVWYLMDAYSLTEEEATALVMEQQKAEEENTDGEEED